MKNIFIVFLLLSHTVGAQSSNKSELDEKMLGWEQALPPTGELVKGNRVFGYTYSPERLGWIDTFNSWIKKSYVPVGGLPQAERVAIPENATYYPKGTGLRLWLWNPAYDASGQKIVKAQPSSAATIAIMGNYIPGIEPATWFNDESQFYFTMDIDPTGKILNSQYGSRTEPYLRQLRAKIGNYLIYYTRGIANVILIPGNRLPIVQLTRGEVLEMAEAGIRKAHSEGKSSEQAMNSQLKGLNFMKEKYKSSLNEPAAIRHAQLTIDSFDLPDPDSDIFRQAASSPMMYPVYRIDPNMYEKTKSNVPQWVAISFPYATADSKPLYREIWKAMSENFNYAYVYDYLFNPEKVKGKEYRSRKASQ